MLVNGLTVKELKDPVGDLAKASAWLSLTSTVEEQNSRLTFTVCPQPQQLIYTRKSRIYQRWYSRQYKVALFRRMFGRTFLN